VTMCRELGFAVAGDPHDPGSYLVGLELASTAGKI
jgi:hypothetical protein